MISRMITLWEFLIDTYPQFCIKSAVCRKELTTPVSPTVLKNPPTNTNNSLISVISHTASITIPKQDSRLSFLELGTCPPQLSRLYTVQKDWTIYIFGVKAMRTNVLLVASSFCACSCIAVACGKFVDWSRARTWTSFPSNSHISVREYTSIRDIKATYSYIWCYLSSNILITGHKSISWSSRFLVGQKTSQYQKIQLRPLMPKDWNASSSNYSVSLFPRNFIWQGERVTEGF